jgi:2-keto-3-deoxy-6-phosphogluconate aldolase
MGARTTSFDEIAGNHRVMAILRGQPPREAAVRGPFPDVAFVATGGLRVADTGDFLAAGARVVALGAALADPEQTRQLSDLMTR